MVITITMKNLRERNGIFELRIVVPKDCQESVGQTEITQTLKTKDPIEAASLVKGLTKEWKEKFSEIRNASSKAPLLIKSKINDTVADFLKTMDAHLEEHLADYLAQQNEDELKVSSEWYRECSVAIRNNDSGSIDLSAELGITYPLPKQKSPGMTRRLNKVVIDALCRMRQAIDDEVGRAISTEIDNAILEPIPKLIGTEKQPPSSPVQNGTDIVEVMNLMFDAKNRGEKYKGVIESEVKYLQEWLGGKSDITAITKPDLVDYARNCLPYIPKNMQKIDIYKGKSLTECVEMVKGNLTKYIPISHQTCKNRFAKVQRVFSYAKDQLGTIAVDPATGIEIPEVRVVDSQKRGYTDGELAEMWKALAMVYKTVGKRPERYWVPVIGLYHGLRLNEICSLRLKDVYQHADGTFVIDVNRDGANRSVKNNSSVRILSVHPYVLGALCFNKFIDDRKAIASPEALLFPNLTYSAG